MSAPCRSLSRRLDGFCTYPVSYWGFVSLLLITALVTYGFQLFTFNLSVDEELVEVFGSNGMALNWLQIGRWFLYLLAKYVVPYPVVPTVPVAIFLLSYVAGLFTIFYTWSGKFTFRHVVASALAISFPSLIYQLSFSMNYGVGIGFFLAALGFFLQLSTESHRRHFYSAVLFGCSIGSYQSLLLVPIVAFFVLALTSIAGAEGSDLRRISSNLLRQFGGLLLSLVGALTFYFLVWKGLL